MAPEPILHEETVPAPTEISTGAAEEEKGEEIVEVTAPVPPSAIDPEPSAPTTTKRKRPVLRRQRPRRAAKPSSTTKRRFHPGTVALREIRRLQRGTENLLPRAPFRRLLYRVLEEQGKPEARFSRKAVSAIQVAAESFLIGMLEESNLAAIHARRTTINHHDLRFVANFHARHERR